MSELTNYKDKKVQVLTTDGRVIVGILLGFDQTTNLIIQQAKERIFSAGGTEEIELGCYMLRGDGIMVVSEIDSEKDDSIDWKTVSGEQFGAVAI